MNTGFFDYFLGILSALATVVPRKIGKLHFFNLPDGKIWKVHAVNCDNDDFCMDW